MLRIDRLAPAVRAVLLAGALLLVAGCQPPLGLPGAGVKLTLPDGWSSVSPDTWSVPGVPLAAFSGPSGSSLVVYRSLPVPGASADALAEELANRLANNPGVASLEHRTLTVAGREAGRVEVVAPGTGDRLATVSLGVPSVPEGSALVPTRRVVIIVPRAGDTLAFGWHMPEAAAEARLLEIEAALASLEIEDAQLSTSGY